MKSIEDVYNDNYSKLTENELYIFDYIIKNKNAIRKMSITELSLILAVSKSTISRFTQKLGFSGYAEFKFYLNSEVDVTKDDLDFDAMDHLKDDVQATFKMFDQLNIDPILESIHGADNVFLYGTGWAQKNALNDFRRSILLYNKFSIDISAPLELKIVSTSVKPGDVLIVASFSGNVQSIERELKVFKANGAILIAVTELKTSLLASLSDYEVYFQASRVAYKNEDFASMLPIHQVTNLLNVAYFEYVRRLEAKESKDNL
jgi:RpiR family glv operon transcriptional regulator